MKSLTIKESRTQVQWRDVKDVLPPVGVPVVVYLDDGPYDSGMEPLTVGHINDKGEWTILPFPENADNLGPQTPDVVTHWFLPHTPYFKPWVFTEFMMIPGWAIANLREDGFTTNDEIAAEFNRLNTDDDHIDGCDCAICRC